MSPSFSSGAIREQGLDTLLMMERPRAASSLLALLIGVFSACGSSETVEARRAEAVRERIAEIDPAFGNGKLMVRRLTDMPLSEVIGDVRTVETFLARARTHADVAAAKLVREMVPDELALELEGYVLSLTHAAACAAETEVIDCYDFPGDDGIHRFAQLCAELVAESRTALDRLREVQAQLQAGTHSASPPLLAAVVGLAKREAESGPIDLAAITAFHSSPLGARWQQARSVAFQRAQLVFYAAYDEGVKQGVFRSHHPMDDLVLPKAEYADKGDPSEGETRPVRPLRPPSGK